MASKLLGELKRTETPIEYSENKPEIIQPDLIQAIDDNNTDQALSLLQAGANPNEKTSIGTTALMRAVDKSNRELVRALLDKGAHVNAMNRNGGSALAYAVGGRDSEIQHMLWKAGADPIRAEHGIEILINNPSTFHFASMEYGWLGDFYRFIANNYVAAERVYLQQIQFVEKYPVRQEYIVHAHNNLIRLYLDAGFNDKAEETMGKAVNIAPTFLDENALTQSELGAIPYFYLYLTNGAHFLYKHKLDEAEKYLNQATWIALWESKRSGRKGLVSTAEMFIAKVYKERGQIDEAAKLIEHLIENIGSDLEAGDYRISNISSGVWLTAAEVYLAQGRLVEAMKAIDSAETGLGRSGMGAENALRARVLEKEGRYDDALQKCATAVDAGEEQLHTLIGASLTLDLAKIAGVRTDAYNNCLGFLASSIKPSQKSLSLAFELILKWKGRTLSTNFALPLQAIHASIAGRDDTTANAYIRLLGSMSHAWLHRRPNVSALEYLSQIKDMEQQLIEYRRELSDRVDTDKKAGFVGEYVDRLKENMKENSVFIEYVLVPSSKTTHSNAPDSSHYYALTLRKDGTINLFCLGDSKSIDLLVIEAMKWFQETMRLLRGEKGLTPEELRKRARESDRMLEKLGAAIWTPLESAIQTASSVYIRPDESLALVPFPVLRTAKGKYLVDENFQLSLVGSGAFLSEIPPVSKSSSQQMLLVTMPEYGKPVSLSSRAFLPKGLGRFASFTGTSEAEKGFSSSSTDIILEGTGASELALKSHHNAKVIHLSSHGFVLEKSTSFDISDPRGWTDSYNPFLMSGIALNGANRSEAGNEVDDGILTAFEITGMDLRATDLVVLSACDVGRGDLRTGEGIYGLRRAFALAGAKNLIVSLWPLGRDITVRTFTSFYHEAKSKEYADALRHAQRSTRTFLQDEYNGAVPPELWGSLIFEHLSFHGSQPHNSTLNH